MAIAARTAGSSRAALALLGDERLARLAAAGHDRAFAIVYERHHQALYRYCRSILRDDADAQDALQSTFAAAYAALGRSGRDAPIRPWLFRIAHNEAVSALRRRRPTMELSEATDYGCPSVEEQVAERAELGLLLRDLRELHERQRSALVMREMSGLSHEEIALALETSVGAAKQAIYEARQSLFEFADGRAMPCDDIRRTLSDGDGRLLRSRRVRAHLRECSACTAFATAIPARRKELRALVPPLPVAAAAGLLRRAAGASAGHGTGGGLAGLTTCAAGKVAGSALAANALAGAAVVATATVGVTIGVDKIAHRAGHPPSRYTPAALIAQAPTPARMAARVSSSPAARVIGEGRTAAPARRVSGASARSGPAAVRTGRHHSRPASRPGTGPRPAGTSG
ncbi:MAG: RNA polymerase sigma factor, partial [Solirubrobacterales bacterium]|nr:RNA polymerase sigma factor [Solirubrobacterales bacterium]